MIDGLIRWSLRNRALVVGLSCLLLVGGTYAVTTVPVDVLPDLTAPTVTILVESSAMAPTDMEALVTFPIEAALNGAPGVRRIRSATAVGVAVIWVEFDWGQDHLPGPTDRKRAGRCGRGRVAIGRRPPGLGSDLVDHG